MPKYSAEYYKLSNCIRILASDAIERANSGHPGMVLGMADVMTILTFNFLKFNPADSNWFNRDRLVLSNGHGSMLLYSFYYLANYKNFNLEDLKQFRCLHSKTPGHPEYGAYSAIETTTGPLGQGLATSVGMAIAGKKYQQNLGKEISDNKIYCIVGDGCLMEGISYEAVSLAGHLRLNNLIVLFDDNQISIDGPTSLAVSEDHLLKFKALGWNVESIDGHDFEQINASLQRAQISDKPYFIACRTLIGKGSINKVNSASAHGSPLGKDEVKLLKANLGFKDQEFFIPQELKEIWGKSWLRNKDFYDQWQENFAELSKDSKAYLDKPNIDSSFIDKIIAPINDEATRSSSGRVIKELVKLSDKVIFGSADLAPSNNIKNSYSIAINKDDFSGNYLHYGVRENAMSAIMNGLAISGFLPIGATFLVFSDYMKPSMRLSCLMRQQIIYVLTHDSIGLGEDGPTHQPIEHLASLRALPNMMVFRPSDYVETAESWRAALAYKNGPSVLALTRQPVNQIVRSRSLHQLAFNEAVGERVIEERSLAKSRRAQEIPCHDNLIYKRNLVLQPLCAKGAYIISGDSEKIADIAIFASGSELSIALQVKEILAEKGFTVKVISVLCFELFFQQDPSYIQHILSGAKLKIAIEAAASLGWHRIIGENGLFFGMEQFGLSAPSEDLYTYFGLTAKNIAEKTLEKLRS